MEKASYDFMHKPRLLFEANREWYYERMPAPEGWHEDYARGKVTTQDYQNIDK
jgi:hypothetical protein